MARRLLIDPRCACSAVPCKTARVHKPVSLCSPLCTCKVARSSLDGENPQVTFQRARGSPGTASETKAARAPSLARGVKRDRVRGQPLSRATGVKSTGQGMRHPKGGLYLLWLILLSFVRSSVDCCSTGYQPKGVLKISSLSGTKAEGRHLRLTAKTMSFHAVPTAASLPGRNS